MYLMNVQSYKRNTFSSEKSKLINLTYFNLINLKLE